MKNGARIQTVTEAEAIEALASHAATRSGAVDRMNRMNSS